MSRRTLERRRFLERMAALTATAVLAPRSVVARTGSAAAPEPAFDRQLPDAGPIQPTDPVELTVVEAATLLRRGELSPVELVRAYLDRIERHDAAYRAFNTVTAERALADARRLENAPGRLPLRGIPLAIKDNFFTAGVPTTANSIIFRDHVPAYDATAWARLRAAGAVLLGKTQMGPLATTAATTPEGIATTVNAWSPADRRAGPGGSSSGSATAVAGRLAAAATGTQTGGSITSPSNAQGLTGIKPTMGRVSLHGIIPLTYTRDHVGPLARDARDAAVLLQAMAGPDPADPRTLGLPPVPDFLAAVRPGAPLAPPGGRPRVGFFPGFEDEPDEDAEPGDPAVRDRERRARARAEATATARRTLLARLEQIGAEVVEIEPPRDWAILTSREFNNVRLPERSEIFLGELRSDVRRFGVSLSPWINGLLLPAAEYVRGQRARLLLLERVLDEVFTRCDVVLQTEPFPFDMIGLPLLAFPIGFEEASVGVPRPIGALLGAPPYEEDRLLALAAAYQRATDWHTRRPAEPDTFEAPGATDAGGGRGAPPRLDLFDVMERGE